ncbi:MAG TPA: molybdenum cofactor guanylyltransferase [Candidatus Binatia bacterium]|jgi:molybdopterin-guanine dinucleotide biosynthesis protein A
MDIDCSGIVIAGGRSRRMGRPKAALPLGGTSMLQYVAARLAPLVGELVVVAAAEQEVPIVNMTGARVVRDRVRDEGPLPALALGLGAIATPWAIVLGCDTPFVRRAVLRLLLDARGASAGVVPSWDGRLQPLVACYRRELAPEIDALVARGERRMRAVAELPGVRIVDAERLAPLDPAGWSFRSLNTPEAYADALRRFAEAAADA